MALSTQFVGGLCFRHSQQFSEDVIPIRFEYAANWSITLTLVLSLKERGNSCQSRIYGGITVNRISP